MNLLDISCGNMWRIIEMVHSSFFLDGIITVFISSDHPYLQCLWYVTGITTAAAALSYITKKDTYKILRKNKNL